MSETSDERTPANGAGRANGGKVLLLHSDAAHASRVAKVLHGTASEVTAAGPADPLPEDGAYDIVVVDDDSLSEDERERLLEACSLFCRTRVLVAARARVKQDFPRLFGRHTLTNLLAKEEEVDPEDLVVTIRKILTGSFFGLDQYFSSVIASRSMTLDCSAQQPKALLLAESFGASAGLSSRLITALVTSVEEMLTNALYNAPVDEEGRHRFHDYHRAVQVSLKADERIELSLCHDGKKLGVSVSDPFGSLTKERVLDYLAKCFRKEHDQVDMKQGGAGVGLYYLFDALSHFVVNIEPNRRTELIGLIHFSGTYRDFANRGKSFNIFTQ